MKVGDEVKMMTGKYAGETATIVFAYPGAGGNHYFKVQRANGQIIERVGTNLRPIPATPNT